MPARRSDALVAVGAAASAARVIRKDFTSKITAGVGSAALRRGMRSGNRAWFYVAAGATGLRLFRKYAGKSPEILSFKLKPGEALSIREIRRAK